MKKLVLIITVLCSTLFVQAQPPMGRMPMGGMGMGMGMGMNSFSKPFYVTESDSVAAENINRAATQLNFSDKQLKKMTKLFGQEYEEECRNIQMSILESQISNMGGFRHYGGGMDLPATNTTTKKGLDTLAVKKTFMEISEKYEKRYGRILEEEQATQWKKMEAERKDKEFLNLLKHVSDNTESIL